MVFDQIPNDFSPKLEVSACFLEHDEHVLFVRRAPNITQGNTWAIPGGKIRTGETKEQACIREVKEEAGINITNPTFVKTVYIRYPEYDYVYHIFRHELSVRPHVQLKAVECTDYAWFTREKANELDAQQELILDEMPCIERTYGAGSFTRNAILNPELESANAAV